MSHEAPGASAPVLVLLELSRVEAKAVASKVGDEARLGPQQVARDYGDYTTVAVFIVATSAALKATAMWLATRGSRSVVRQSVEVRRADGTVERHELEIRTSEVAELDAQVLAALTKLTQLELPKTGS